MADEQVIGVAQLRLEADAEDLIRGLQETAAEVDKTGASFAQFTEKGEKEGAALAAAVARSQNEIAAVTESSSVRQLRAVDERTRRTVELLRSRGAEERDIEARIAAGHREKWRILAAEEKRGTDVAWREAIRKVEALKQTEKAAHSAHGAYGKTAQAVNHLGQAFGYSSGEAGKAAGALMHLMNAAVTPVGLAIAGLALFIGDLIKKHEEQAEAAKKATEEYERQMQVIDRWAADMGKAQGTVADAEIAAKERERDRLQEWIDNRNEQIRNAIAGSGDVSAAAEGLAEKEKALELLNAEIFRLRAKFEIEEAERKKAEEDRNAKAAWDALKKKGEEERKADDEAEREEERAWREQQKADEKAFADLQAEVVARGEWEVRVEEEALAVLEEKNETVREAIALKEELLAPPKKDRGLAGPLSVNGSSGTSLQTTADLYIQAQGRAVGSLDIGAIMRNRGTTVNVFNAPPGMTVKTGPGGSVDIDIAGSILNGGETARAIEDAYGLQRGGSGR